MSSLTRYKLLVFFIAWMLFFGVASYLIQSPLLWGITTLLAICLGVIIHDMCQIKHALLRNYPLLGRLRWVFEHERSKIQQYFIENDTNGEPFNREKRSDVYQKAKNEINTTPFGTQLDVYQKGYEFLTHSMYPKHIDDVETPKVLIGSSSKKPYLASIFNISAMSFGALSDAAIKALNGGAKLGGFYHNTGEGGVSPYHKQGGDLCYQIGTGYFGAGKTVDGVRFFSNPVFYDTIVKNPEIKMVEVKLSQGAKPGHGGILPASKNSLEISQIRGVEPYTDVMSPPFHTAFNDAESLLEFIENLRDLSDGLPIGIKLCIGSEKEFTDLVVKMKTLNIYPDFITIDGGEGGTGAAPMVFTNNIGMPLIDALVFVHQTLKDYNVRDRITLIVSGKASNSFDIIKLLALGADVVNAARAFLLSLGCIQARECNKNTCPVGIATQDKTLVGGLNPEIKRVRVFNYHKAIIHEIREVLGAMGLKSVKELTPTSIIYRKNDGVLKTY